MSEGVPVRTIAMMVIATVIAAIIVGLILIYFGAPPGYIYTAALAHAARLLGAAQIISTAAIG